MFFLSLLFTYVSFFVLPQSALFWAIFRSLWFSPEQSLWYSVLLPFIYVTFTVWGLPAKQKGYCYLYLVSLNENEINFG